MLIAIGLVHIALFAMLAMNLRHLRRSRSVSRADERSLPSLSVLIPARNEADNLSRLIPQLIEQKYDQIEVIVFDDGSEDATPDVLREMRDERIQIIRGEEVPEGWVGKVHALYRCTRQARGNLYLFLDADVVLGDDEALQRLVVRHQNLPASSVMTGLTQLQGHGLLLVSLVTNAILTTLPWPLLRHMPIRLGALNGQCWAIRSDLYHLHEPHRALPGEVLEDVRIGGYLAARGVASRLVDARDEVHVPMYASFGAAWRGFRKNAYLLMGGHPVPFLLFLLLFSATFVVGPLLSPVFLASLYVLKLLTDRIARMPWWVTLFAPISYVLAVLLQLDSATHHWLGRVEWKGRRV